jgi:small-conductance mechanosensitive channel
MTDIILGALIALPILLAFFLKSNAGVMFLSICAGYVLTSMASFDIQTNVAHLGYWVSGNNLNLILLAVPLFLTALLARHGGTTGIKMYLNLAVAVCAGGLLALLAARSTGYLLNTTLTGPFWDNLLKYTWIVVTAGALLSLLQVWMGHPKHKDKKHK